MRILVACADYPNLRGGKALNYVHVRNKEYIQHGISVTVLNFSCVNDYEIDNIPVISLSTYKQSTDRYDILVSHAPNVRNHYLFLKKYQEKFSKLVFFFHGHEVVRINEVYPPSYDFLKQKHGFIRKYAQNFYDSFKLRVWHYYFPKVVGKSHFVFVSNSLYKEFLHYTKISEKLINGHVSIIYNSVGKIFEEQHYEYGASHPYDFITIRSNLDSSVYCIDLLVQLAEKNPQYRFLLIGQGRFFDYVKKPDNIEFVDHCLNHDELLQYINQSKCALMLTRRDSQGVMSCELAAMGIPLITSDLDICREIFAGSSNVQLMSNDLNWDIAEIIHKFQENRDNTVGDKYYAKNTVMREIELLNSI